MVYGPPFLPRFPREDAFTSNLYVLDTFVADHGCKSAIIVFADKESRNVVGAREGGKKENGNHIGDTQK